MKKDSTEFRKRFQAWKDGKDVYDAGRPIDLYLDTMEKVAKQNAKDWEVSEDVALLRALNDNTYNYKGYYDKYPESTANAKTHWTDEFKTVYHPTFSNESQYHGKKSQYNPHGLRGGMWIGDKFQPATWLSLAKALRINKLGYQDGKDGLIRIETPDEYPFYLLNVKNGDRVNTEQCATWQNNWLRSKGYKTYGNAWNLKGVRPIYSGFLNLPLPEKYDSLQIARRNQNAADSVYKYFDSKTLDKSLPYVVNMYYNGTTHLKESYSEGNGITGTHTGILTFDPKTNRWWVTHNIGGTIHSDPFVSLLHSKTGKGQYGVTGVYLPLQKTFVDKSVEKVKQLFGFEDGKDGKIKEEDRFATTEMPELVVTAYAPLRLTTYYPMTSDYPFTGHSKLEIPIDRSVWNRYTGENPQNDRTSPYMVIDKTSDAKDYNLITNNCADATLRFLNKAFNTSENPWLFTTPGDVRDYALKRLNGKLIKNNDGSDTVLIPRNKNNSKSISTTALDMFYDDTSYLHYQGPFAYTHKAKYTTSTDRGRLTALKKRTGKSEAELYRSGGPAVRKMITFARNARKWHKN